MMSESGHMQAIQPFEFATAPRIIFGDGRLSEVGRLAATFGRRVLIVTGRQALAAAGVIDHVRALLEASGCTSSVLSVPGEPTVSLVDAGVATARMWQAEVLLAIGGGSTIDAAKAIAGLATNAGEATMHDYLEGVGTGRTILRPALPVIAAPTTAGTGAEVTKNAVITDDAHMFKKSIRSDHLLPRVALVDPILTHTAPPAVTAASGLDALTQLIESYTSNHASPITDALAETGIQLAARSLVRTWQDGSNADARRDMALASLLGGMCLANAGLGAVHGMASPLGAFYPAPHGAVCAALLPHVVAENIHRLRIEAPQGPAIAKYRHVAKIFGITDSNPFDRLVARLRELVARMGIPGLGAWGLDRAGIPRVVAESRGSSTRYNPVLLVDDEIADILEAAR